MRLYEFANLQEEIINGVVVATQQLKDLVNSNPPKIDIDNFTIDNLIDFYKEYDIVLSADDFYLMIEKPLLKDVISNIQDDKIVFRGNEKPTAPDEDPGDSQETVAKMAQSAMSNNPLGVDLT